MSAVGLAAWRAEMPTIKTAKSGGSTATDAS